MAKDKGGFIGFNGLEEDPKVYSGVWSTSTQMQNTSGWPVKSATVEALIIAGGGGGGRRRGGGGGAGGYQPLALVALAVVATRQTQTKAVILVLAQDTQPLQLEAVMEVAIIMRQVADLAGAVRV